MREKNCSLHLRGERRNTHRESCHHLSPTHLFHHKQGVSFFFPSLCVFCSEGCSRYCTWPGIWLLLPISLQAQEWPQHTVNKSINAPQCLLGHWKHPSAFSEVSEVTLSYINAIIVWISKVKLQQLWLKRRHLSLFFFLRFWSHSGNAFVLQRCLNVLKCGF